MSTGVIQDGWEFIAAAYGIAWGGLVLYGATLYARWKKAAKEDPR
jgi:hypothetical protein